MDPKNTSIPKIQIKSYIYTSSHYHCQTHINQNQHYNDKCKHNKYIIGNKPIYIDPIETYRSYYMI